MPYALDYLIVGAGPAGVQLGYYFERQGRDYAILEAGHGPGTFFETYPRHRRLISINKRHTGYDDREVNLRWDWNSLISDDEGHRPFGEFSKEFFPSAEALLKYLDEFVRHHAIRIEFDTRVVRIEKHDCFVISDERGRTWRAKRLIMATGMSRTYVPDIPGVEFVEDYSTMSIDADAFSGQRVLILGKGNSAFETADHLIASASLIHIASPSPLKFAWKTHFVGHLRAVNNNFIDTYLLKTQNAVLDATVKGIRRDGNALVATFAYTHAHGETEDVRYDRVLCCTGFRFDASIFDDACRPALCPMGKLPQQTASWGSVNVPDLFFAGTVTQYRDYKTSASPFIHGFRYNTRALSRMLAMRYHDEPWPSCVVEATPEAVTDLLIKRINRSSGLWQLFEFMADVVVVDYDSGTVTHFEEQPVAFAHESAVRECDLYFLLTLEYGQDKDFNPFAGERIERTNASRSSMSNFLHPVIRAFRRGNLVGEHHVIEDLAAEWREEEHIAPLLEFMRNQLDELNILRRGGTSGHGATRGVAGTCVSECGSADRAESRGVGRDRLST